MKVAVIGRGFGSYAMKPAFEACGWDVELVPSRDAEAVKTACRQPFDLVAVHSPPFQHREHVLMALASGYDVLCDKPFGRNGTEAHEMRDAAKAAGRLHFLNYEFRCNPGRAKVQELIAGGAIGELRHIHYAAFMNFLRQRDHGWINEADKGGGALGALASHVIDGMLWCAGSTAVQAGGLARRDVPVRADGQGGEVTGTAEDAFSAWLRLANGVSTSLDVAVAGPLMLPQRLHYVGSAGAIEMVNDVTLTLRRPGQEDEVIDCSPTKDAPAWSVLQSWIGRIEASLKSRKQITPSFDDGVAVAEAMDLLRTNWTMV